MITNINYNIIKYGVTFYGQHTALTSAVVKVFARLSLLTMTSPNQMCEVLLFMCSKTAEETNLSLVVKVNRF